MPEWSGSRLQSGPRRFDSGFDLHRHPLWSNAGGRWLSSRPSYRRPARFDTGACDHPTPPPIGAEPRETRRRTVAT